jgi:excisionase family DNA binding protein
MMENYVNVETAANFLSVKPSHLYALVRTGKIPSTKVGALRRFRLSELDAWAKAGGSASKGEKHS